MKEDILVKNIFTVNGVFFHTAEAKVNPRRVKGEENFPFIDQAGLLKQHIYKKIKRWVNFESLFNFS